MVLGGVASIAVAAEGRSLPPDAQIERAVRVVWMKGGNYRPLCSSVSFPDSDQQGFQELRQTFVPGQWVVRYARTEQRSAQLQKLDHLARFGLLERRDTFLNSGPIRGLPGAEYRPTRAGWVQSMAKEETATWPCFYYGMAQVREVFGYTESPKDDKGFGKVKVDFLKSVEDVPEWAKAEEATKLFPDIKASLDGQLTSFTFYRDPGGKLRTYPENREAIDDTTVDAPAPLPGMEIAMEAIERTRQSQNSQQAAQFPRPCLPLLSKNMPQLWDEGKSSAATQAVLRIPETKGTYREIANLAYARLMLLQQAGLLTLRGDPERGGEVVVRPSPALRELLALHGNCLPLGKVRIDLAGIHRDESPGNRQIFKARYVVEDPAPWIRRLKNPRSLPDLAVVLRDGQPFEGTTAKTRDGWTAAYLVDRRPELAPASLSAVGVSAHWRNVTELSIARTSVVDHEVHLIDTYGGAKDPRKRSQGTQDPAEHVDVVVKKGTLPLLIVVSAYRPIEWRFRVEQGARVDAVLALGYYEQQTRGLPGSTKVVSAYAADGMRRIDPAMTLIGTLNKDPLSRFGARPASMQKVESDKAVTVGGAMKISP